jgi:drug/metabolite transporter (DMT)-like permease
MPMEQPGHIDAAKLIGADLDRQQRRRRRHFIPALAIVVLAVGAAMLMMGLRPDLLEQPWWQLALQCVLWLLCLIVFPAIGLGLLFPSRGTRLGLAAGAVGLTVLATLGVPESAGFEPDEHGGLGCSLMITLYATVVLLMGLLSGAFVQRRKTAAVYWIAAGIALTGLTAITWQCPVTGASHILPSHLGVAAGLMIAVSLIGVIVHRRRDALER